MSPPPGLRWRDESEIAATLRPRRLQALLFAFGALWNFAFAIGAEKLAAHPPPRWFMLVGLVGGAFFALCALRALAMKTSIVVERGELVLRNWLAPWSRFRVPLGELTGFSIVQDGDGTFRVAAAVRGAGAPRKLPLDAEAFPFGLHMNGSKKRLWPAPQAYSAFMAERLWEIVEAGRRAGHDTYRT